MNPQADNTADQLKQRLNQTPPSRPSGPLHVPERPGTIDDIDDSAFNVGDQHAQTIAPMAPIAPPKPSAQTMAAPSPLPIPPPSAVTAQSVQPVTGANTNPLSHIPPMPVTPVEVVPETAPAPPPVQPKPAMPVPPPSPKVTPSITASYQPPTQHITQDLIERIDETPQQNSKDIEELIEHNHRLHRLKGFASFLIFCAGVVVAAFLINQFVFQSYYVDGTSMTPTLQNNDRLIIDKIEHTTANLQNKPYIPARGQIVVLDSSIIGFNGREEQLIKRVIGLPGDTISIHDGTVTIKNKQYPDGFDPSEQLGLHLALTYVESAQEWTIPDGQVFVMGDNRVQNGSYDSRAFGPIEANKIVGRLWARILPFDKAQVF